MLFVGDDWAEDHHDVALVDEEGRLLARRRLPEGIQGIEGLHGLIADHLDDKEGPGQVLVGIETDRGPWVSALLAADYTVFAVNSLQAARTATTGPRTLPPSPKRPSFNRVTALTPSSLSRAGMRPARDIDRGFEKNSRAQAGPSQYQS